MYPNRKLNIYIYGDTYRNRETFRESNAKAIEWLHKHGFKQVLLRTHCRHKDLVYATKFHKYLSTDYWNHWDGMCFDRHGYLWFIQIKTSGFPKDEGILEWMQGKKDIRGLSIHFKPRTALRFYYNI